MGQSTTLSNHDDPKKVELEPKAVNQPSGVILDPINSAAKERNIKLKREDPVLEELPKLIKVKEWHLPETLEAFLRFTANVKFFGKKTNRAMQELLELLNEIKTSQRLSREHIKLLKSKKIDVPKGFRKIEHPKCKYMNILGDIYMRLLNSFKIAIRKLKFIYLFKNFKSKSLLQFKKNRNIPPALLGLLSFITTIFKRISTRGIIDGINHISEFTFECERQAIGASSDGKLLRKYFVGELQRMRTNSKALSLLATLRRAMPAINLKECANRALKRTVSGMCGPVQETSEENLESLREHVRKFCSVTKPHDLNLESGFTSLGSCFENPRSKGGSYAYIHQCQEQINKPKNTVESKQSSEQRVANMVFSALATTEGHKLLSEWKESPTILLPRVEASWDQTIKKMYMFNKDKPNRAKISVIAQSGCRFRTATVHEAALSALIAPACKQVTEMLKIYGPCRGQFKADSEEIFKRSQKARQFNQSYKIYSTDLSQASDLINKNALYVVVNELAKELKWPYIVKQAVLKSVQPTQLYIYDEQKCEYKFENTTTRGTLLGSPLSFCLMTIIHAWCLKAVNKILRKACMLFGDDAVIFGTDDDWNNYLRRLEAVGFMINRKKTHISTKGFAFCGYLYSTSRGRLTPCKLSRLVSLKDTWVDNLDLFNEAAVGLLDWQQKRAVNRFKRDHAKVLKQFVDYGISIHAPRELGGVGLLSNKLFRLNHDDRLIGTILLTKNKKMDEIEIIRSLTKSWVRAYLPENCRALVETIHNMTRQVNFDPDGVATYREVLQTLIGHTLYRHFISSYQDVRTISKRISPRQVAEDLWYSREKLIREFIYKKKFSKRFEANNDKIRTYIKMRNNFTISNDSLRALELGTQSLHLTVGGVVRYSPLSNKVNKAGLKPDSSRGRTVT
jgi:IS1 family transposase